MLASRPDRSEAISARSNRWPLTCSRVSCRMAELEAISVKDARERYMDADKKAVLDARAKLNEATKGWTAEQLLLLASIAAESNAPVEAEQDDHRARSGRRWLNDTETSPPAIRPGGSC